MKNFWSLSPVSPNKCYSDEKRSLPLAGSDNGTIMNEDKYICYNCVGEEYISNLIRETGKANRNCSYCNKRKKNVALEEIAELLHTMFILHYEQPEDGPFYYDSGEPADYIIQDELHVDEEPARDLLSVMADTYNDHHGVDIIYDEGFHFIKSKRTHNSLGYAWERMEKSLRNESRYFNQHVKDFLDELFSDIETLKTDKSQIAIREASNDVIFYRARVFENIEDAEKALEHPERFFGPPPNELARSGRMNAHGIPVFYGATSSDIAVAEVRPVVGSYVVVVPFRPLRELRILDISALNSLTEINGSIFDQRITNLNEKANFMRTLSRKLTLPVSGKKPENEYLITQAVSEYLSVSDKYRLDGISFDSTQHPRRKRSAAGHQNVVLFSKSSGIKGAEPNTRSYNVELYEHVEDNEWNFAPTIQPLEGKKIRKYSFSFLSEKQIYSLEIISDRIVFHKVKGILFDTDPTEISLLEPLYPNDAMQNNIIENDDFV